MHICILVGSIKISGGTYVIFQHAHYLQTFGYKVTLAIQEEFNENTAKWHDLAADLSLIPIQDSYAIKYDLVIATWWKTALELHRFNHSKLAYFVQSIESRFYPQGEVPLKAFVDSTYDLDVHYCTEATWIKNYLLSNHKKNAELVPNGIRKDIYLPKPEKKNARNPRVLIEGPFNVAFKNTGLAIAAAKKAGAKEIWVLTGSVIQRKLPNVDKVFSNVPIMEAAKIYQQCDVLIKLSTVEGMFGPPLEMFHCGGTSIVLDVTGHDEYIEHEINGVVISSRNYSKVVSEIYNLIKAMKTAEEWPNWAESSKKFQKWIEIIQNAEVKNNDLLTCIKAAEQQYIHDENMRLNRNAWIKIKSRTYAFCNKAKGRLKNRMIYLVAVWEIINPFKVIR